jgi:signal recognition particle receptor subunit beta
MSTINPLSREVSAKIVYVGPGLSGKTTSLQHVHSRLNQEARSELVSLATDEDRTLFFDFLPLRIPRVNGLGVRLQLYTVPGQVFYAATRKLVLNGADGIVFVADAQRARREANVEALNGAFEHLRDTGVDLDRFPVVFQYNKQDLGELLEERTLQRDLNPRSLPHFLTVATEGTGVLEALRAAVRAVVGSLRERTGAQPTERPYAMASPNSAIARQLAELTRASAPNVPRSIPPIETPSEPAPTPNESDVALVESTMPPEGEIVLLNEPTDSEPSFDAPTPAELTTERPVAGVSFSALWEASQRAPVDLIESCISQKRYHDAVHHAASALANLLTELPVPADFETGARALLLGLYGREYLRLCRLASQPKETIRRRDALFALYFVIAARIKHTS